MTQNDNTKHVIKQLNGKEMVIRIDIVNKIE